MWRPVGAVGLCVALCVGLFGGLAGGLSGCVVYLNPLCTDQISNGDETDIDCGGICGRCEIGDSCKVNADCADSDCQGGSCTAFPCFNGKKDADETDVDCGGACRTCAGGRVCDGDADCASGVCDVATQTCFGLATVAFDNSVTYAAPMGQNIGPGDKPYVMLAGDLDGDGDDDLAAANELESTISVLSNAGGGAFVPLGPRFPAGDYPTGGVVIDFNADGKLDVVTADYHGDSVTVMLNPGSGQLTAKATYPTVVDSETSNLAVGDLDGNTTPDVVATNPMSGSISVFLSSADGTLSTAVDLPVGAENSFPFSAAIADFSGDGRNDVAIADSGSGSLFLRIGNGDGTFQPELRYAIGGISPYIVITADVNDDGRPDLVTANRNSDNISVLLGRGDGTFRKPIVSPTGPKTRPYSVAVGDFNRDGVPDVVTGDYTESATTESTAASVLIGIGNGTFEPPILVPGLISYGVAVGNFNGDGNDDFAVANFADDTVTVKINTSH